VVWIGLLEPSNDLLRRVQSQLGLHDLAIIDACKAHQRPKLERYDDAVFIVVRTAQIVSGEIGYGETHLFVGQGYVVSVRHGASVSYAAVRARCESSPKALARGEDYILYAILDFIVDNYQPVLDELRSDVDRIEDGVLNRTSRAGDVERMYGLRRDLLRLRNAIVPLAEVCRELDHAEVIEIEASMLPLFRDVTDHVLRCQEEIDTLRDVLAFAFEASVMMSQTEQTAIARRLAAWAAILAVPTAVAGIYGMNFEHMPELKWRYGYFVVLGVIALACGWLFWRFRRNGWI
jgi:magnesium transporter